MDEFLRIYLRDQLAMAVGLRELARRSARSNRGTDLGVALEQVATTLADDTDTMRKVMHRLRITPDPVKNGAATVAERVGRLKTNGRLRSYSPLSRFEELELLTIGLDGKQQMWTTLRDLAALATRLPDIDFDALVDRLAGQRDILEPFRAAAGSAAFAIASRDA